MNNYVQLEDLIKTISKTHKFDKEKLIFLNTSDVSEGKILINHYMPVSELKGQAKKTIKNGDILYSEIRPKNKRYAYVNNLKNPEDYVVSTKLMVLRNSSKDLDTDYLYHFLTYEETLNYLQRRAENRIGSFPQITFDVLKTLQIWLPEIDTQKQISKVLSDLDAKIEVNNKINQELEAMAKLIYDYWFVQFDFPFDFAQGKPSLNGKPYKSSGGKMVFNQKLKRELPDGWKVNTIKQVLKTDLGGTPSTKVSSYWNGTIPWLNSGEIADFPLITSELKVTQDGINNSATTLMPSGSCVLSITRHLRPSVLAVDSCVNQSVVGFFESDSLKSSYIYPYLVNEIPRLMSLRTGAQQPHINKGIVDASFILSPPTLILEEYYELVDSKYKKIINNAFQNQKLAELRDWLLPMLMNGQVTVGEAREELGMVAEDNGKYGKG
jgi:type I restriction enzyme S subunit